MPGVFHGGVMRRVGKACLVAALCTATVALSGCNRSADKQAPGKVIAGSPPAANHAVLAAAASPADDGNWTMPGKDYGASRFSGLNQINPANVGKLALSFTFSTGTTKGFEAPPLVVDGTMYIVTPFPNILYALDLTKPGAPTKWVFKPKPLAASQGVACCDVVNRGAVYDAGKIFFNTLDGQTIAVDANSGQQVWRTQLGDIQKGETITMAPLVAGGKVLVGNSGGEMGVRGWIAALDEGSGKLAWSAYNTGPDKDVLIGSRFKPFYAMDQGKDLGVKSWPPDAWKIGGGTVWGWLSYDPETEARLLRHRQSRPVEPRPAARRQQMDDRRLRPRHQHRRGGLVLSDDPARSVRPRRHQRDHPRRHAVARAAAARCCSARRATASSTCRTAAPARCCRPTPFGYVNAYKGVDLKTGRMMPEPRQGPQGRAGSCATSAPPRRGSRTGTRPRSARSRAWSTSRTSICAWTSARWRRTTSPARPMSAPT